MGIRSLSTLLAAITCSAAAAEDIITVTNDDVLVTRPMAINGDLSVGGILTSHYGNLAVGSSLSVSDGGIANLFQLGNSGGNAGLELGRTDGQSSVPFIDFHSGQTPTDYDARIIASYGNGNPGEGLLEVSSLALIITGTLSNKWTHGSLNLKSAGDGASIEMFSPGHPTNSNQATYDANVHSFRDVATNALLMSMSTNTWTSHVTSRIADSSLAVGGAYYPSGVWGSSLIVGEDGTNKLVAGYLASNTNAVVIGGHRSDMGAWADIVVSGNNSVSINGGETTWVKFSPSGMEHTLGELNIRSLTADNADHSRVLVSGGGNASQDRGSYVAAHGNEHSTQAGDLHLASGLSGEIALIGNAGQVRTNGQSIWRNADNDLMILSGGNNAHSGANIELHGPNHSSQASRAYYDAASHNWRDSDGAPTYMTIDEPNGLLVDAIRHTFRSDTGNIIAELSGSRVRLNQPTTILGGSETGLTIDSSNNITVQINDNTATNVGNNVKFQLALAGLTAGLVRAEWINPSNDSKLSWQVRTGAVPADAMSLTGSALRLSSGVRLVSSLISSDASDSLTIGADDLGTNDARMVFVDSTDVAAPGISRHFSNEFTVESADGSGSPMVRLDRDTTAGNTRLLLYDVDTGKLQRVSVGSANSGGSGYRILRIPNQ